MAKEECVAKQLLEQVDNKIKQIEVKYKETGSAYNLFKIAEIGEDERIITKVMANLLNPKGLHYQGNIYLKAFLDEIVWPLIKKEQVDNFQLPKAKIKLENSTNEGRLIDITINDGTIFIPIEVKINAREQPKQLFYYARFSELMNKSYGFIPVLFLTKDGYPSKEAEDNDYICISFKEDIICWLEKCLNLEQTQQIPPVREIIKQLIKTIKSFCDPSEGEEMESAIKDLITERRANFILAKRISDIYNARINNLDNEVWEIFKEGGQIYKLIVEKEKLPDAKIEVLGDWSCLAIPIGNGCTLYINYDIRRIKVVEDSPKRPDLAAEIADEVRKVMYSKTQIDEIEDPEYIWGSSKTKYPDIEDTNDDIIYNYDLHQIYSTKPQEVANWIISLAKELKEILK